MMRRDDEIRLGGHFGLGHGKREERRLSLREREALRRKAREAEYEDEEDEDDEDLDDDEDDDEEDEDEEDYDGDEDEEDDDEEDDDEEDDDEEDEDEEDEDELDEDDDDEDYDGDDDDEEDDEDDEDDDLDDENESDEEDEDDRDDDDEDSYEPSPAPSKPVSGSDDRDAFIAEYLAEKERELALEREAAERAEKEERERQESARREEQARVQAEEEERARRAEKAEIARRAREAEDRASTEDRLGRTRALFNGTEGYRGKDSLDRVSPVSGRSGGSQRESYTGREPVLSESDRALRERELALKEREIALKERELALREREQQLKSAGSHSGKSSSVSPASYTTRVINGKTVKVKDTGKKVSKPIEEPVALSQDNRSKRYEGLSDESLMKEVTAFMLRYGVKKHGIPYELMAEEFGAGLIAKLIIRGHLVRLGDSTLTCGNN